MLAELTPDRKHLFLFEGDTTYKTYHVLLETDLSMGTYLLFTDGQGDPWKILAARITCHEDGTLETFTDKIHATEWKELHAAFQAFLNR